MTIEQNGIVIAENYTKLGLPCSFVKGVMSPLGVTLYFNLDDIADYNERNIKSVIKKQAVYCHLDMQFVATKEAHFSVFVKLPTNNIYLTTLLNECNLETMPIGKDIDNKVVNIDFDKTPHLLIAGTTGSGKTILLKNLIMNICGYYPKHHRDIELYILDTKFELERFAEMKGVRFYGEGAKALTSRSIFVALKGVCSIMDNRYKGVYKNDYEIFVIIDELADLMLTNERRADVEDLIVRLASKGRACGIHLIIATQRPTANVCSGLIKANMPNRIALKTANVRDSVVILDHKGAEELQGNGDCIFKQGLSEKHIKIAYPEEQLIQGVIKLNRRG